MTQDMEPMWRRIEGPQGLEPTFEIKCVFCGEKMILRRSRLHQVADVRIRKGVEEYRPYAFDMAYKCPRCAWYTVFGVAVPTDYAQEVTQRREGQVDFVLPEEIWEEDERVKRQLSRYGYFGGMLEPKDGLEEAVAKK